jgi:hypothetical protein
MKVQTRSAVSVPPEQLTPIPLTEVEAPSAHLRLTEDGVVFVTDGWYEVLMRVDWDPYDTKGTRFAHTNIPEQEPLHSEAINASVLARISGGSQRLRGNSVFGPERTSSLALEVWHDSAAPVRITHAELVVRELQVPWPPG